MIRLLDLFSGIGGFSLAAQWAWGDNLEIVSLCEINKFCQIVLRKHWPDVPIINDVRDVNAEIIRIFSQGNDIDVLTGGFPCQPFSCAGKRKGKGDDRFLWPEMFRIIKEIRPRWVVAENVAGIVRMALDDCLSDLESEGYSTQAVIIPACAVNAPHRRDRVWIVAHDSKLIGWTEQKSKRQRIKTSNSSQDVADSNSKYKQELFGRNQLGNEIKKISFGWRNAPDRRQWESEPDVGRVAHGVPNRVDRLKSLGNAIVPQVAYRIFKLIQ